MTTVTNLILAKFNKRFLLNRKSMQLIIVSFLLILLTNIYFVRCKPVNVTDNFTVSSSGELTQIKVSHNHNIKDYTSVVNAIFKQISPKLATPVEFV